MTDDEQWCPGSGQSDWKRGTGDAKSAECSHCGHLVPLRYIGWWAGAMPCVSHTPDGRPL